MANTSTKGTKENPYSMSECDSMLEAGTWPGGYVKDDAGQVSYVMKSVAGRYMDIATGMVRRHVLGQTSFYIYISGTVKVDEKK